MHDGASLYGVSLKPSLLVQSGSPWLSKVLERPALLSRERSSGDLSTKWIKYVRRNHRRALDGQLQRG